MFSHPHFADSISHFIRCPFSHFHIFALRILYVPTFPRDDAIWPQVIWMWHLPNPFHGVCQQWVALLIKTPASLLLLTLSRLHCCVCGAAGARHQRRMSSLYRCESEWRSYALDMHTMSITYSSYRYSVFIPSRVANLVFLRWNLVQLHWTFDN